MMAIMLEKQPGDVVAETQSATVELRLEVVVNPNYGGPGYVRVRLGSYDIAPCLMLNRDGKVACSPNTAFEAHAIYPADVLAQAERMLRRAVAEWHEQQSVTHAEHARKLKGQLW
jgi:hypothetical protein